LEEYDYYIYLAYVMCNNNSIFFVPQYDLSVLFGSNIICEFSTSLIVSWLMESMVASVRALLFFYEQFWQFIDKVYLLVVTS